MMGKINWADKTCKETVWLTPESILDPVRRYFGGQIPLDPLNSLTLQMLKSFIQKKIMV